MIIESNQTEFIMAERVAHARFKYDLQKTSKEDDRGTLFIISDTPSIRLIFTFRLPDMNKYQKHCKSCRTRRFCNLWYSSVLIQFKLLHKNRKCLRSSTSLLQRGQIISTLGFQECIRAVAKCLL